MIREQGYAENWLQPTGEQARMLRQVAGQKRFVWNRALSIEQARYRRGEKRLGCKQMMRELTRWREKGRDTEFLREAPVHALQCVLWELYESYQRFFKKTQKHPPQFKKKSSAKIAFTESDSACFELDHQKRRVKLPKLGWVKCRYPRPILGKPNSITVKFEGGHWLFSVQTRQEVSDPVHPNKTIVAGDFGVVQRVTWSDGNVDKPIDVSWEEQRIAFYQRRLKNKKKFGRNWQKMQTKIGKLHRRIANIGKDATHKATSNVVKSHAVVVVGDLNIKSLSASAAGTTEHPGKNVAQKSGLNRAILRQGWHEYSRQLEYKLLWSGGIIEYQSEAYTSQECPRCHFVSKESRKSQAEFACKCGFSANADEVAATNQLQKFLSSDKGQSLLASGYCASVNSLGSGRSWDSATNKEPAEAVGVSCA
jgi:putative transposase